MSDQNQEDELFTAFKKQQEKAREKAEAEGKSEVTQGQYESHPLIRLRKIYERWSNRSLFHAKEEYSSLLGELAEIDYSFFELQRFHEIQRNSSIEYALFMCAASSSLKSGEGSQPQGTELHPFLKSERLLPLLLYLKQKSRKAQVKVESFDTVVLTSQELAWASFDDYDIPSGTLIIDCQLGPLAGIGSRMRSGTIKITQKVRPNSIGWEMQGGTIIYDGDFVDGKIGERMKRGTIIVKGDVRGKSEVGYEMEDGDIVIEGDYNGNEDAIFGVGYQMKGGNIRLKNFYGPKKLGCYMSGGTVEVGGDVKGSRADVGTYNKSGSRVHITGDCMVHEIGCLMGGGTIEIGGDAGADIGSNMKYGKIHIGGTVHQTGEHCFYPLGSMMDNGKIIVGGDVKEVSNLLYGGEIHINGRLVYEDSFGGAGKVYVKGRLVKPGLLAKMVGKLERSSYQR